MPSDELTCVAGGRRAGLAVCDRGREARLELGIIGTVLVLGTEPLVSDENALDVPLNFRSTDVLSKNNNLTYVANLQNLIKRLHYIINLN